MVGSGYGSGKKLGSGWFGQWINHVPVLVLVWVTSYLTKGNQGQFVL